MSGEAFDLSMAISGYLYARFIGDDPRWFPGDVDEYELQDSDVGEPFILLRKRDGKRFEVSVLAEVDEATT